MISSLTTRHGELALPAFLPDATRGVVRALDADDLVRVGIPAVMVNTLHLGEKPGASVVKALGGIHRFMGWDRPVSSDSGGFQVYSLAQANPKNVSIGAKGFVYRSGPGAEKRALTPEKCIEKQWSLGSDILFCLDLCTHPSLPEPEQRESVEKTVRWAKSCKEAFERRVSSMRGDATRPLLFAVVQGGESRELRRECAERLLEIGFDGYGYGGWPIRDDGMLVEAVRWVSELIPGHFPKHALGVGKPDNLVRAYRAGYTLFDCVLPTRDARRGRLFAFLPGCDVKAPSGDSPFFEAVYIDDRKHIRDARPIDEGCDCPACSKYSRGFLHHLFQIKDASAARLASLHNLRFYARLLGLLRAEGGPGQAGSDLKNL